MQTEDDAEPQPLPTRVEDLRSQLRECQEDLRLARKQHQFTAMASLHNSRRQLSKELYAELEREKLTDPEADMSDEELLEVIIDALGVFASTAPSFFEQVVTEVRRLEAGGSVEGEASDADG